MFNLLDFCDDSADPIDYVQRPFLFRDRVVATNRIILIHEPAAWRAPRKQSSCSPISVSKALGLYQTSAGRPADQ